MTVSVGSQRLALALPDATFSTTRFRTPGQDPVAPSADVRWGTAALGADWSLVAEQDGTYLMGEGYRWDATRATLTLDAGLRASVGLAYNALIDAAMSWHVERVVRAGGLLLHAACLGRDSDAVVVAGPSHSGKSTLCQRLESRFLSEEYAFVVPTASGWQLHWFGERRAPCVERREQWHLEAIHWMTENRSGTRTWPLPVADAIAALWPCVLVPSGLQDAALGNLSLLAQQVPVRALAHSLETPVAQVETILFGEEP